MINKFTNLVLTKLVAFTYLTILPCSFHYNSEIFHATINRWSHSLYEKRTKPIFNISWWRVGGIKIPPFIPNYSNCQYLLILKIIHIQQGCVEFLVSSYHKFSLI